MWFCFLLMSLVIRTIFVLLELFCLNAGALQFICFGSHKINVFILNNNIQLSRVIVTLFFLSQSSSSVYGNLKHSTRQKQFCQSIFVNENVDQNKCFLNTSFRLNFS